MNVFLLIIGSEITEGTITDTHTPFLAHHFTALGHRIVQAAVVPDSTYVSHIITQAVDTVDLIITTGGLGPTSDDITREEIARAAGVELVFNEEAWSNVIQRFKNRTIPESNKKQAFTPGGFKPLWNNYGTAPGLTGKVGGTVIFSLPGPPGEMRGMYKDHVEPYLKLLVKDSTDCILRGTAFLVSESLLEQYLLDTVSKDIQWATQAQDHRLLFSLSGSEKSKLREAFSALQSRFGPTVVLEGEIDPVSRFLKKMKELHKTCVFAESCTGGLLGAEITAIPGSSDVFLGSFVVYSNRMKEEILGVKRETLVHHGAVSQETVTELAANSLKKADADVAVSVSGIAGPGGGSSEKPVGTVWIGVASREKPSCELMFCFPGDRNAVRRKAVTAAYLFAYEYLFGIGSKEAADRLDIKLTWQYT